MRIKHKGATAGPGFEPGTSGMEVRVLTARPRQLLKFQIVRLPVDPTLYTFSKTAHEKGMGDQP